MLKVYVHHNGIWRQEFENACGENGGGLMRYSNIAKNLNLGSTLGKRDVKNDTSRK